MSQARWIVAIIVVGLVPGCQRQHDQGGRGGGSGTPVPDATQSPPADTGLLADTTGQADAAVDAPMVSVTDDAAAVTIPDGRETTSLDSALDPDAPPFACTPRTTALASPLPGTHRVLWRSPIDALDIHGGVALSKDRIAVTAAHNILFYDRSGRQLDRWGNIPGFALLSVPVVDGKGTFYAASDGLLAFDTAGKPAWRVPLRMDDAHGSLASPPLLSPDGVLYTAEPDGYVTATSTAGKPLWRVAVEGGKNNYGWGLAGGFGDTLVLNAPDQSFRLLDRRDGHTLMQAQAPTSKRLWAGAIVSGLGIVATVLPLGGMAGAAPSTQLLDFGLQPRWSVPTQPDEFSALQFVNQQGELVMLEGSSRRSTPVTFPDRLLRYSCGGTALGAVEIKAGTAANFAQTFNLGADGVSYAVTAPAKNASAPRVSVVAFGSDFRELWRIDLDGMELPLNGRTPATLDADGVLYLALTKLPDFTGELVAIQTSSPGPAPTTWPRSDGNGATGTAWATP